MKRLSKMHAAAAALLVFACAGVGNAPPAAAQSGGSTVLFDGKSLDNFNKVGDANWRIEDGAVVADKGTGFLVTKTSYTDFQLRAEFWADEDANSGIYIRCTDPAKITADNSYEVNIYDKRPEPIYGTGAIVNVAKVDPMPKAGGKWNVYEIEAKGPQFTVVLNGQKTVDGARDDKFKSGPIALQYAPGVVKDKGVIKFRKVEIRPL
ncbi:MAG TPA: DUF1080 domain-containing protein [Beijerinckiaceae bacterium]|nr:DUF1080 domain-containing protein [Beijerinckiaceae bacterium]